MANLNTVTSNDALNVFFSLGIDYGSLNHRYTKAENLFLNLPHEEESRKKALALCKNTLQGIVNKHSLTKEVEGPNISIISKDDPKYNDVETLRTSCKKIIEQANALLVQIQLQDISLSQRDGEEKTPN